ncbi:MAG: hypothetical protein Q9170_005603 [Blastenia crenularia]
MVNRSKKTLLQRPSPIRHQRASHSLQPSFTAKIRHPTIVAKSSEQSPYSSTPYIEPNPNPQLPNNFCGNTDILTASDTNDPDFLIYRTIENDLNSILDAAEPYFRCAVVIYGTIGLDFDEEGYDPYENPKVLAIQIEEDSIHRWREVENQLRTLIVSTYQRNGRAVPPVRYIAGGFELRFLFEESLHGGFLESEFVDGPSGMGFDTFRL